MVYWALSVCEATEIVFSMEGQCVPQLHMILGVIPQKVYEDIPPILQVFAFRPCFLITISRNLDTSLKLSSM